MPGNRLGMEVSIINPLNDKSWDDFVLNHKYGSIYHLSNWSSILQRTFSYTPYYLAMHDSEGKIEAGIPFMLIKSWLTGKRLINLPKLPYCDPLVEERSLPMFIEFLLEMIKDRKIKYFEIKTQYNKSIFGGTILKSYTSYRNHVLRLDRKLDETWKSFDRSCVRQRINKALKMGVIIREGNTIEDLKVFYSLFKNITEKHIIPLKPFNYFYNIWEELHPKGMATMLIAEARGEPAASTMSFAFQRTMYYEYLGLNYELSEFCPGQLLVWELIQKSYHKGLELFDFGITSLNNPGLIDYKKRWGAVENDISYFYYPDVRGYKTFVKRPSKNKEKTSNTFISICLNHLKKKIAEKFYRHFG